MNAVASRSAGSALRALRQADAGCFASAGRGVKQTKNTQCSLRLAMAQRLVEHALSFSTARLRLRRRLIAFDRQHGRRLYSRTGRLKLRPEDCDLDLSGCRSHGAQFVLDARRRRLPPITIRSPCAGEQHCRPPASRPIFVATRPPPQKRG